MLVGEAIAVEAMAFAARSTGVVMEATGAVVVVTQKVEGCEPDYTLGESLWIGVLEARIAR